VGTDRKYWSEPTAESREVIGKNILNLEGTHGVANPASVAPESYTLDAALLERKGNKDIQLDLFLDYASNVKLYPKFQEYFGSHSHRYWRSGVRTIPFLFQQERRPIGRTCRTRRSSFWIRGILQRRRTS
jgi:hypothetical protein